MTAIPIIYLFCDHNDCCAHHIGRDGSTFLVRRDARRAKWTAWNDLDYCPAHSYSTTEGG